MGLLFPATVSLLPCAGGLLVSAAATGWTTVSISVAAPKPTDFIDPVDKEMLVSRNDMCYLS